MNALELCRVLLAGSVPAAEVPELTDEKIRADVARRLAGAGCGLHYAPGSDRWVATLAGPVPDLEEHARVVDLGPADLTVLAACWLHLRFLPSERVPSAPGQGDAAWLDPDDLGVMLGGRLGGGDLPATLERLCQAGYLTLREGQVFAGPLLETFDDQGARDRAKELVARNQRLTRLRQRAAEIRFGERSDATDQQGGRVLGGRGGSELPPHGSMTRATQSPT